VLGEVCASRPAAAPAGETLRATVTLLDFTKDKESWDLPDAADKLAYAETNKAHGNGLFSGGEPGRAAKRYAKALKMVEHDSSWTDTAKATSRTLKLALHSNLAACYLKTAPPRFADAARSAAAALELDSSNGKARFRAAQAAAGMHDYVEAEAALRRLLTDDPGHADAARELARVKVAARAQNAKDAQIFGKMFGPRPTKKAAIAPEATPADVPPTPTAGEA
jgi:peptidylprolyl isomerase